MALFTNELPNDRMNEAANRVPYIVFNLPKKNDNVLQSDILSIIELHYGVSPTVHIHCKTYGPTVIKYASFKLISPPDPTLKKLHGFVLDGHHLIVCQRKDWDFDKLCYHDPQKSSVWIYNIPKEANEEDVWKLFETCGKIKLLYFIRDERKGVPLQSFVMFEERESLDQALRFNGQPFLSQGVRLKEFVVDRGLFIRNLQPGTKMKDIETFFQDLQPLHSCYSANACSARLYFANEPDYWKAIAMNRKHLNGASVIISGVHSATRHVYVTNLPSGTTALQLKSEFDWNVKSLKKCNHGITKLTFETTDKAEAALRVSDPVIHGANITLYSDFPQASYAVGNEAGDLTTKTNTAVLKNGNNKDAFGDVCVNKGPSRSNLSLKGSGCDSSAKALVDKLKLHKGTKRENATSIKTLAKIPKLDKAPSALRIKPKLKKIIMKKGWSVSSL